MVGEKGKRYYNELEGFTINDTDDIVFTKIVDYLKDSIRNKNSRVIAFFEKNEDFRKFFSNSQNKTTFIKALETLNTNDKLAVRNYYLILLHQLSAINYKDKSHFVSTTKDYKTAKRFGGNQRDKTDQVILHCWQPILHEKQIVLKCGLPAYKTSPYSYQKEITIFGGIFPHFISGIEVAKTKSFYPNPNIFNGKITKDTFLYGLNIDQSNFEVIAKLTNYKKTIITDGKDTWENSTKR